VDRAGHRVKLASVNWYGAESPEFVVGGLDRQPLSRIASLIERGGFNSVRLPWSNQLVEQNPVVPSEYLAANPRLQGKRALDVLDAVVRELGRHGLMVVLDNHRSRADWCCDEEHGDGLWYTREYPPVRRPPPGATGTG
jgi:endoglucanase